MVQPETLVDSEKDRDQIILEMLSRVQTAEEPGTLKEKEIIAEDGAPTGGAVTKIESAGYVFIYCTRTGLQSRINRNGLSQKLRDKHTNPDFPEWIGKPAFHTDPDKVPTPFRGNFKCLLHKDHPDRALMDAHGLAGLQPCTAAHLESPFEVTMHMGTKHKRAGAAIQHMKDVMDKEKSDNRQDKLIEAMIATAQGRVEVPVEAPAAVPPKKRTRKAKK